MVDFFHPQMFTCMFTQVITVNITCTCRFELFQQAYMYVQYTIGIMYKGEKTFTMHI